MKFKFNKYVEMVHCKKGIFFSFIFVAGLLATCHPSYGQETLIEGSNKERNAFYVSAGTFVLWHGASATMERTLQEKIFNKNISSFVKLGAGYYLMWDWEPRYGGPWTFSNYGWLIGKNGHYFEVSAGVTYAFSGDLKGLFPSGALGYRYKKPQGNLIFRANASFPEALNLGVGFTF
jgi:hypothetical protein